MGFPANRGVHGVSGAPVVHPVIVHATAELTIYWFPKIGAVVATFPANRASAHARHQLVASPGSRAQGVISGHAAALHGVVFRTGAGTKPHEVFSDPAGDVPKCTDSGRKP
jgi:hypothetical protein